MFPGWLFAKRHEPVGDAVKLIVGLGNPGPKYTDTRHNIGFRVIDELTRRYAGGKPKHKFQGEITDVQLPTTRALLLKPQTFMNRSGTSVLAVRDFYKMDHAAILIICDDFQLPLGRLRIRLRGSAGGQKGLAHILRCLGSQEVPRLRIGIDSPPAGWQLADYVLSKFATKEVAAMAQSVVRAADAVEVWAERGIEVCMNEFNRVIRTNE